MSMPRPYVAAPTSSSSMVPESPHRDGQVAPRPVRGGTLAPGTCAASHTPCAERDHQVLAALPDRTGTVMSDSEKPQSLTKARSSSHQPSAVRGSPTSQLDSAKWSASLRRQRLDVDGREQRGQLLRDLVAGDRGQGGSPLIEEDDELGLALLGDTELLEVVLAHARQEVQPVGVMGCDACDDQGGADAVGEERGARERVRTAARPAGDEAVVDAEGVEHGGGVGRHRGDGATGLAGRTGVPRPRPGDQAQTALLGGLLHCGICRWQPGVPWWKTSTRPSRAR